MPNCMSAQSFFGDAGGQQYRLKLLVKSIAEGRAAGRRKQIWKEQIVAESLDGLDILKKIEPEHFRMQRNVALGLVVFDPSARILGDVEIRNVTIVDDD